MPKQKPNNELCDIIQPFVKMALKDALDNYQQSVHDISLKDYKDQKLYAMAKRAFIGAVFDLAKLGVFAGLTDEKQNSFAEKTLQALIESSQKQNADYDRRHPCAQEPESENNNQ